MVNRGVAGPLTLLAAPAGFGKTHLLMEWAKASSLPTAWLTIEADDNDLSRFARYLTAALQTLQPGLGDEALDFLQSSKGGGLEVGLTLLINEISALPQEMALVLDDFQLLEAPLVLAGVNFLLKHCPPNLHIIIASRTEPALDLAFLRAKGRVVELGVGDLRFTRDEVIQFFQQRRGLQLSPETAQSLEERTDGWVTALQMAAISLRHQADPTLYLANLQGDAHYLVEFLAEEVLDRQPEEVRQFLLRSSILDTLTGSLCETVVKPEAQPGYGAVMLDRLASANLFIIPLDAKHEWFRYHPLFAEFLRHVHAEINPAEIPMLHKRAALWFEQEGNLDKTFQFAFASGDLKWAADLVERNVQTMIKLGEISAMTRWIGKLPDEIIHQRTGISLPYAWGLISAFQLDHARFWLENVKRKLAALEQPTGADRETFIASEKAELWNMRGGLAICESSLALLAGDIEMAAEFTRQATGCLQAENPFIQSLIALDDSLYFIQSGDTQKAAASLQATMRVARQANNLLVLIIAACLLAETQVLQGRLGQAWATLEKAQYMAAGPDGKPLPLSSLVDVERGEILLERDALEEANRYLERGYQISQSHWSLSRLDGMVALARLRQAQGDVAGSQAILEEAGRLALSTESSQWDDTIVSVTAVRLALQREDLAAAEQWWQRGRFTPLDGTTPLEQYPYQVYADLQLIQARFLLTRGRIQSSSQDIQRASDLLEALLPEEERFQRVTAQMEILVLQAMAGAALGDARAGSLLLRALALGEPQGYRRIYLDEGRRLAEILPQCRAAQEQAGGFLPSLPFIDGLLADIQQTGGALSTAPPPAGAGSSAASARLEDGFLISLSAREMEVLALIAEGKSNKEIAAQLYLAVNTVKRHAYNIYAKLEVKKRSHAVIKARQLGLIP